MLGSSGRSEPPGNAAPGATDVQSYFVRQGRYTAGVATRYPASALTGEATHQHLATGFELGTRFHSAPVIRIGDAKSVELGHAARADGRWRLYAFADREERMLFGLFDWLMQSRESPVRRYTPQDADIDAVLDVRAILQRDHREVTLGELPALLHPRKGAFGLLDYEKAFTSASASREIFESRGIDRELGCAVIVRPDQFVAHVLALDGYSEIAAFFDAILLPPAPPRS
jgi:phenol 2-monooxygenase